MDGLDFDADGHGDVVVGVPGESAFGSLAGAAYLYYGPVSGSLTLGTATADVAFHGDTSGEQAGERLAGVPDVDGDGDDELLIGAPLWGSQDEGRAYLLLGVEGL